MRPTTWKDAEAWPESGMKRIAEPTEILTKTSPPPPVSTLQEHLPKKFHGLFALANCWQIYRLKCYQACQVVAEVGPPSLPVHSVPVLDSVFNKFGFF